METHQKPTGNFLTLWNIYDLPSSMNMNLSKTLGERRDRKTWHTAVRGVSKSQT